MAKIVVEKYLCVKCGQCIGTCPARLFSRNSVNDYPAIQPSADEHCISCHHCVAVCPAGAIAVNGIDSSMCEKLAKENVPRFDHIVNLTRMRRSIRRYADKPLDKRVIEQMLDVVRWAPSAKNGLPVKWLVINHREKILELEKLVAAWVQTQPQLSKSREAWEQDAIFRGAPCVVAAYTNSTAIWPSVDVTIAVETLDLCVTAMRLGSCWAGFFVQAAQHDTEINRWLGLGETQKVHGALMLGYPGDEIFQRIPYRPEQEIRWL